ncbi:hypothetical protein BLX87_17790, partial [Bacillus sp. VT-16-64]
VHNMWRGSIRGLLTKKKRFGRSYFWVTSPDAIVGYTTIIFSFFNFFFFFFGFVFFFFPPVCGFLKKKFFF